MDENDTNENTNEGTTSENKLLKQSEERQEYMMKLQKWLDDARLWHYNICARIPTNNVPTSNANIMDNILRQYSTLQTNLLHQHLQNILLNSYSNNFNRNVQSSFNASEYAFPASDLILEPFLSGKIFHRIQLTIPIRWKF